jgi:hypothetical protein
MNMLPGSQRSLELTVRFLVHDRNALFISTGLHG